MFCPKCGAILKTNAEGKYCSCGYQEKTKHVEKITETIEHKGEEVIVRDSKDNPLATEKHTCPKCGCEKAILVGSQIAVRETWNSSETDRPAYICACCGYKDFI